MAALKAAKVGFRNTWVNDEWAITFSLAVVWMPSQRRPELRRYSAVSRRRKITAPGFRRSSCSHTRRTVHPELSSAPVTTRSRSRFLAILVLQKILLFFGRLLQSQPCQKQPSTKTTNRRFRNTKSGFPINETPRLQPVIPAFRMRLASFCSVVAFPELRLACIRRRSASAERAPICKGVNASGRVLLLMLKTSLAASPSVLPS